MPGIRTWVVAAKTASSYADMLTAIVSIGFESNFYDYILKTKFSELVWATAEANQIKK